MSFKEVLAYIDNAERMHKLGGKPKWYVIHETQNFKAYSMDERNNIQNNKGEPSFHSVVDHKQVVRCIPFNVGAWHARDGNGEGNMLGISLEICSSSLSTHTDETWENVIEVISNDLKLLGMNTNNLKQHHDFSDKNCPKYIRDNKLWEKLIKDVKNKMDETHVKTDFEVAREWIIREKISDGSNPKEPLTREQLWATLYRFYNKFLVKN